MYYNIFKRYVSLLHSNMYRMNAITCALNCRSNIYTHTKKLERKSEGENKFHDKIVYLRSFDFNLQTNRANIKGHRKIVDTRNYALNSVKCKHSWNKWLRFKNLSFMWWKSANNNISTKKKMRSTTHKTMCKTLVWTTESLEGEIEREKRMRVWRRLKILSEKRRNDFVFFLYLWILKSDKNKTKRIKTVFTKCCAFARSLSRHIHGQSNCIVFQIECFVCYMRSRTHTR